jgi:hypothetical protein
MRLKARWYDWVGIRAVSMPAKNMVNVECWIRWWHPRAWAMMLGLLLLCLAGMSPKFEVPS